MDTNAPTPSDEFATQSPGNAETIAHQSGSAEFGFLHVRCPGCHLPIDIPIDTSLTDVTCSSCGSHFSLVDQSQDTRMAAPLSTMGRFELVERIGVGGFGTVWKARDKELDRTVALKIPRASDMPQEAQEKFFREARTAAQLRHPNIVSVHEVGREGETIFIVSDFVRGVTLGDWLTGQQLTSRESAELCIKIAEALDHAHEKGVIHRDLKPANIMIDGDGQPHLMDFGLARREVGEVTMTMDGQVLGTPAYMSPEQAQGDAHTADGRSDLYSLGVILFQMLTGERPFRGNARMLIHQVIHDEPPTPRKFNANIPRDLETIVLKCLEKDPDRRYQTAQDVAKELRRFLAGEPIHARPIGRIARGWRWAKRHRAVAVLGSALLVSLVVGLMATTFLWRSAQKALLDRESAEAAREAAQLQEKTARAASDAASQQAMKSQISGNVAQAKTIVHELEKMRADRDGSIDRARARQMIEEAEHLGREARKSMKKLDPATSQGETTELTNHLQSLDISLRNESVEWLQLSTLERVKSIRIGTSKIYFGSESFDGMESLIQVATNIDGSVVVVAHPEQEGLSVLEPDSNSSRTLKLQGIRFERNTFGSGITSKMAISPDGSQLIILDYSGRLIVFDLIKGTRIREWTLPPETAVEELKFIKNGEVLTRQADYTRQTNQHHQIIWNVADGKQTVLDLKKNKNEEPRLPSPWNKKISGILFDAIWSSVGSSDLCTLELRKPGADFNILTKTVGEGIHAFGFGGDPHWLAYCIGNRLYCYDQQSGITVDAETGDAKDSKLIIKLLPAPDGVYAVEMDNVTSYESGSETRFGKKNSSEGHGFNLVLWRAHFSSLGGKAISGMNSRDLALGADGTIAVGGNDSILQTATYDKELWNTSSSNFGYLTTKFQTEGEQTFTVDWAERSMNNFSWRTEIRSAKSGALLKSFPATGVGSATCWDAMRRFAVVIGKQAEDEVSYDVVDVQQDRILRHLGSFAWEEGKTGGPPAAKFSPNGKRLFVLFDKKLKVWEVPSFHYSGELLLAGAKTNQKVSLAGWDVRNESDEFGDMVNFRPDFDDLCFDPSETYILILPTGGVYRLPSLEKVCVLENWREERSYASRDLEIRGDYIFALRDRVWDELGSLASVWELRTGNSKPKNDSISYRGSESKENSSRVPNVSSGVNSQQLHEQLFDSGATGDAFKATTVGMRAKLRASAEDQNADDSPEMSGAKAGTSVANNSFEEDFFFSENSLAIISPSGNKVLLLRPRAQDSPSSNGVYITLWDLRSDERTRLGSHEIEIEHSSPSIACDHSHVYLQGNSSTITAINWSSGSSSEIGEGWIVPKDIIILREGSGLSIQVLPEKKRVVLEHTGRCTSIEHFLSPDRRTIVLIAEDWNARGRKKTVAGLWDLSSGKRLAEIPLTVSSVRFDGSSRWCVTVDRETEEVRVVDCRDGRIRHRFAPPWLRQKVTTLVDNLEQARRIGVTWHSRVRSMDHGLRSIKIDSTGTRLLLQGFGLAALWDAELNKEIMHVKHNHHAPITHVAHDPKSRYVATGGAEGGVIIWDRKTGTYVRDYVEYIGAITALSFDHEGKHLLALSSDGTLTCWGSHHWKNQSPEISSALSLACHPSASTAAIGTSTGDILFFSIPDGKQIDSWSQTGDAAALCYSADGTRLASGSKDGSITVWNVAEKKPIAKMKTEGPICSLRWLKNSDTLASAGQTIEIWDIAKETSIWTLPISKAPARAMDLQPDRGQIVVANAEGTVQLIDLPKLNRSLKALGVPTIDL